MNWNKEYGLVAEKNDKTNCYDVYLAVNGNSAKPQKLGSISYDNKKIETLGEMTMYIFKEGEMKRFKKDEFENNCCYNVVKETLKGSNVWNALKCSLVNGKKESGAIYRTLAIKEMFLTIVFGIKLNEPLANKIVLGLYPNRGNNLSEAQVMMVCDRVINSLKPSMLPTSTRHFNGDCLKIMGETSPEELKSKFNEEKIAKTIKSIKLDDVILGVKGITVTPASSNSFIGEDIVIKTAKNNHNFYFEWALPNLLCRYIKNV